MKKSLAMTLIAASAALTGWAPAADTPLPSEMVKDIIFVQSCMLTPEKAFKL